MSPEPSLGVRGISKKPVGVHWGIGGIELMLEVLNDVAWLEGWTSV